MMDIGIPKYEESPEEEKEDIEPLLKKICYDSAIKNYQKWEETGEALYGIKSFQAFSDSGHSPPQKLIKWVASCFGRYMVYDRGLEEIFGISRKNIRSFETKTNHRRYAMEIGTLVDLYDISVEQAIECVGRRCEEIGKPISEETLKDSFYRAKYYDKKWLKIYVSKYRDIYNTRDHLTKKTAMYPEDIRDKLLNALKK